MHVPLTEGMLTHEGVELARATLPPGDFIIGRQPGVDVRADTPLLSRQHARLTINYDHLLLEDLASAAPHPPSPPKQARSSTAGDPTTPSANSPSPPGGMALTYLDCRAASKSASS